MSSIRNELVYTTISKAYKSVDYNIHNDIHKQYEFRKQQVLTDDSLTNDEKTEAINILNKNYDRHKILYNSGTKRICENCNQECLATTYCEFCVRDYLEANFSNWSSGNYDIDNLIRKCQIETLRPDMIVEWIPYENFQNIKYLTKGGCSEIYTAIWIDGHYIEWNPKQKQLKRFGTQEIVLKGLGNIENSSKDWFDEAKSHLTISNKWASIVQCYGITQDPSDENHMLVMLEMAIDLRKYLQKNHKQLTWKKRIQITSDIINALYRIHLENAIHRDLHSGNILYSKLNQRFCISDLGFCGPVNKPLKSTYGNLPYIAPEVIIGKQTTKASDIYSIAMLMWEISSGQRPFIGYEHNYDLAMNIVNGIRPKNVLGTPLEYKGLMKQCWDSDPLKRPDIYTILKKIDEINLSYQNTNEFEANDDIEIIITSDLDLETTETNYANSLLSTSKIYQFENLFEPKNATEEEQEAFHSKPYDFEIPDNINKLS